jgi:hypothetical protein
MTFYKQFQNPLSLRERAGVRANHRNSMHPHPALSQRERVLKLVLLKGDVS